MENTPNKSRAKKIFAVFIGTCLVSAALFGQSLLEPMGIDSEASEMVEKQNYKPQKKKSPPAQHSGAEGLPPLPLPAVPLRRTEKKNPPKPPVLVAKLATDKYTEWATSPDDVKNLLRWMSKTMDANFSTVNLPQKRIPSDAEEIPVLYRSGIDSFRLSEQQRENLRQYLLSGGTLILNAYCGHPKFSKSALRETKRILPEKVAHRLEKDHPLYRTYHNIKKIRYRDLALKAGAEPGVPSAIGVDINTRTAIFFFRYDLSTAWAGIPSEKLHIIGYERETALKLGTNLAAYVTAQHTESKPLAQAKEFVDADSGKTGKMYVAQAKYNGIWQPRETSLSMLLDVFHKQTGTPVRFQSETIPLESSDIFEYPLVFMAGTIGFSLSKRERRNLRTYLQQGGILFAEATCGRRSFDRSFREEMNTIFSGKKLQRLSTNHPVFQYPEAVSEVKPRPALAHRLDSESAVTPVLYGMKLEDHLAVIYSPYDLSGGWTLSTGPYNQGIQKKDALSLGVNILSNVLIQ